MITSNVKEIMKNKRIKIRDLAKTGISSATMVKARSDEGIAECRLSTLSRIAEALGVSVKDLFEEVEEPKG